ncbi:SpoIIE family protein phosphatase [Desulfospira joergensenii]|uniref:SpoIIE family protein phosphatase n=1 Tax=Desulfospira joergensenii TaxID=53329 RepID=UPI0003B5A4BE|nr:SpoIIE family protein phosphatase [Desulfospira joergensenii]
MFSSMKFKILFFISIVMIATAGFNIYFSGARVGDAMVETQKASMAKILEFVGLNTKAEYRRLLSEKTQMTLHKKRRLKETAQVILSVFESYQSISRQVTASKKRVSGWIEKWVSLAAFDTFDYLVLDKQAQVIYSSTPDFTQEHIDTLTDIKGRELSTLLQFQNLSKEGEYALINPGGQGRLIFLLPYPDWEITIATTIDTSDIESEAQEKLDNIVVALNGISKNLVEFKDGFSFMFDQDRQFLISPGQEREKRLGQSINLITGNPVMEDMMAAAKSDDPKLLYIDSKDVKKREISINVSYFKNLDWYIGVAVPLDEIKRPARELVFQQSLIIFAILLVTLMVIRFIVGKIASPLKRLTLHAKQLPSQDFTRASEEDSPIRDLPEKYRDEIGELASSFIFMEKELKANISNLIRATEARQKIQSELNVAQEIQMGILPKTFPTFPEFKEFDLHATLKPAREVGGDLYDFFQIDNDHICFTLGDVSDKGVPAALFMVITRTLIKTTSEQEASPGAIMTRVNAILAADNPRSMFVTLIIGIFNFRTGKIVYANGGHNPPVLIPKNGPAVYEEGKKEPIVGVMEMGSYTDIELDLEAGDCILLYTDGVTEAMNRDNVCFSEETLLRSAEAGKGSGTETLIKRVMADVESHAGGAPQSDDIAMLGILYNG